MEEPAQDREFSAKVHNFLSHSPKHAMMLAKECRVTYFVVRSWSGQGKSRASQRETAGKFMESHANSCACNDPDGPAKNVKK